jgi:hypothetical protein
MAPLPQESFCQLLLYRRHDTQHNDFQYNDTQHKGFICDTQLKWQSALQQRSAITISVTFYFVTMLNGIMLGVFMLNVVMLSIMVPLYQLASYVYDISRVM